MAAGKRVGLSAVFLLLGGIFGLLIWFIRRPAQVVTEELHDARTHGCHVLLEEKGGKKFVVVEVVEKATQKSERKKLVSGSVIQSSYLPPETSKQLGVRSTLELVEYRGGWEFKRVKGEAKILVHAF